MKRAERDRARVRAACGAILSLALAPIWVAAAGAETRPGSASGGDWPQWGGSHRNFMTDSSGLATRWPEGGPPRLWSRPLGEGYSAIAVHDDVLYTMFRDGERESVIALSAADAATVWQHDYEAPTDGWRFDRGAGPHATPALAGDQIFTVGATARLHALRRSDGEPLWSRDLMADLDASFRHRGYSPSPLVYGDTVLVPVGGTGQTIVAFRRSDGSIAWRGGDDDNSYSSPILIELDGREELVVFAASEILGLDPATGEQLWSHPHPTRSAFNISTPLWGGDGLLFVSSAYDGGGRVIELTTRNGATAVEELWFSNQVRIHFGTAIRLGDVVYASSGDFGPAPMAAVDVRSGEVLWRDRAFAKASLLHADGRLIVLDEDGVLGLAVVSRDGLDVLARAQVVDGLAWTVPTLVGSTLYVRSREAVMALDLGE